MQVFGCVQVRKLPECSSGVLNLAGTQAGRQAGRLAVPVLFGMGTWAVKSVLAVRREGTAGAATDRLAVR